MRKIQLSTLLVLALMVVSGGMVRAELTPSQIVDRFNSFGPHGWSFAVAATATGETIFTGYPNFDVAGAYCSWTSSGSNSFRSLCIETGYGIQAETATLSYFNGNSTVRASDGYAVSVGAALLYKQYATGEFASNLYNYASVSQRTADTTLLLSTLRSLLTPTPGHFSEGSLDWTGNKFLAYLLTVNNDKDFWTGKYNPGQYYNVIGDYAIFVMNLSLYTETCQGGQFNDFLYIAKADYGNSGGGGDNGGGNGNGGGGDNGGGNGNGGGSGVPEPATLLLWSLGSLGAFGMNRYRRTSTKK